MAIINSVATATQGFGSGFLTQRTGIIVTSGTTYSLPSSGSVNGNPVYRGKIRVKVYNGTGTTPALSALTIQITDGTNTIILDNINFSTAVSLTSTNWFDYIKDFLVDYSATGGGATGTLLGPGTAAAIVVQVIPTLTGTGPSCTMDVEVCAEP